MDFIVYDLIFLGIFVLFIGGFLYRKRKELKKEGILLLYKTKWGMKLINNVGGKHKKTLSVLSYISIMIGYLLMIGMVYLFSKLVWTYVSNPLMVRAIKIPPIMPLIPYIDKIIPGLPNFYFISFIIIIALIAIPHEFAHGIFMKRYGVKVKSTGFGFLPFFFPIFLAAFVEQDEKSMQKASKFKQMAILSAGTFANVLTGILFFLILLGFFSAAFTPAGVVFNDYSYSIIGLSTITSINNIEVQNISYEKFVSLAENSSYNHIEAGGQKYLGIKGFTSDENFIALYNSAPAIKNNITGAIIQINGNNINSLETLSEELEKYSIGESINLTTNKEGAEQIYFINLEEHPEGNKAWLGVVFSNQKPNGIMNAIFMKLSSFKSPNIYYASKIGNLGFFIYDLIWWIILISFSVALVNMLPVGIFDGGRFFHLTIWGLTKKEKFADSLFKLITWLFLFALLVLMFFWAKAFF